jgi:hypothetical protein
VAEAPSTSVSLDAYRERADRFLAELDQEHYLHYAGLKDTLDVAAIYERYADLTNLETARGLGDAAASSRNVRELWRFSCDGFLGNLTRDHAEREARVEATLEATIDGNRVPFRMLRPTIANEPDREKRREIDRVRCELTEEHLNPIHHDAWLEIRGAVRELGRETYLDLHRDFGMELDELAEQCREVLDATEKLYEDSADRVFRARAGVGLAEAERFDVARVFRATEWDPFFRADRMVPALEHTLSELGIDLRAQRNVHLDVEQRPQKTPRAFCAPIEIPGRIMLVIQPQGGPEDWRALFHEAGHTEHFAHTSADLPVEERRLGDHAITEGWAMLLQHLVDDPRWLTRRLDFPRPHEFASEGAVALLYVVRRYCAKLLYELEFQAAGDLALMADRYVELLGSALKIEPARIDYLNDIDSGFYVSAYLRSWAFEAQMRRFLREELGNDWFARREAGSLLRELWELGQKPTAEELLRDVTGDTLELSAVADDVRERI